MENPKHTDNVKQFKRPEAREQELQYFVRIANTDLNGKKPICVALTKIKGIGNRMAQIICNKVNIEGNRKAGSLTKEETVRIEDILKTLSKCGIPSWVMNRQKDVEEGLDRHIVTSDLIFCTDNDIKNMKKIKSYKGIRHSLGLTVRGQRTKSNSRKNKGKLSLGVQKKASAKAGRV